MICQTIQQELKLFADDVAQIFSIDRDNTYILQKSVQEGLNQITS